VHAFVLGGANAHVILQRHEDTRPQSTRPEHESHLLGISAKSEAALRALSARYAQLFREMREDPAAAADMCYTAGIGRSRLPHRLAIVARGPAELAAGLESHARGQTPATTVSGHYRAAREPRLGFRLVGNTAVLTGLLRTWNIVPAVTLEHDPATAPDPAIARRVDIWIEIDATSGRAWIAGAAACAADSQTNPIVSLLRLAGELFVRGVAVDWSGVYRGGVRRKVDLPFYPFQRKRYTLLGRQPAQVTAIGTLQAAAPVAPDPLVAELRSCTSERRPALASRYVDETMRRVLRITDREVELDMQMPLVAMGIDSIMSTEIANAMKRDFEFEVPVVALLDGIHLQGVIELLCRYLDERQLTAVVATADSGEWEEGEV
jgi:acyl transferase domain-containing protein